MLLGLEIILADAADGAYPIVGDVLERCSWGNATIGISYCGVVDVAANFANVLHNFLKVLVINEGCYSVNNPLWRNVLQTSIVAPTAGFVAEDTARTAVEVGLYDVLLLLVVSKESSHWVSGPPDADDGCTSK